MALLHHLPERRLCQKDVCARGPSPTLGEEQFVRQHDQFDQTVVDCEAHL